MANIRKRTRQVLSPRTTTLPQSDRVRVLTSIYNTMQAYTVRQAKLNFAWWFDKGMTSSYQSEEGAPE